MGFLRNNLIYFSLDEIAKQSHGLRYTTGSLGGNFWDLLLHPVLGSWNSKLQAKTSAVTAIVETHKL